MFTVELLTHVHKVYESICESKFLDEHSARLELEANIVTITINMLKIYFSLLYNILSCQNLMHAVAIYK